MQILWLLAVHALIFFGLGCFLCVSLSVWIWSKHRLARWLQDRRQRKQRSKPSISARSLGLRGGNARGRHTGWASPF